MENQTNTSLFKALPFLLLSTWSANAELPELNLSMEQVTISGLSSGGYMANQFHLSHAEYVSGVGIIAAGPFMCAQNSITTALARCVDKTDMKLDLAPLNQQLKDWSAKGKLAPLKDIKKSKVWLLHGTKDQKVLANVSDSLYQQYADFIEQSNLTYINDKPFAHHFPTKAMGNECDVSEAPFIGNCDYDAVSEMMNFIAQDSQIAAKKASGKLHTVSQEELGGEHTSTLAEEGFLYIPQACAAGQQCNIHVSFHGCNQNAEKVNDAYVKLTGLNEWADSNYTVVLYPQTAASMFMPLNPQGCWDWWGYTNEDYANKKGPQIMAVDTMIRSLAGK